MGVSAQLATVLTKLQWRRGLRAGVAVAVAMVVCQLLGKPTGWAALGGFEAILVDNGGPYRSRLTTMATVLGGGALACVVGAVSTTPLAVAVLVTAVFCFAVTFARVMSQPVASTSAIVLVLYFAGYGGATHTLHGALGNALAFVLGGAWAALLSLALWPVDPFRPARYAVAGCFELLAHFTAGVEWTEPHSAARETERRRTHDLQRNMRLKMEAARNALETTAARTTARTVRARNLTVLLETADILFAQTIRWVELVESLKDEASQRDLLESLHWMSRAEQAVADGLQHRPQDGAASFAPDGSHSIEHVRRRAEVIRGHESVHRELGQAPIPSAERAFHGEEWDALQNIEIAFESVRAVWTGAERSAGGAVQRWKGLAGRTPSMEAGGGWMESLRANWTPQSLMMRHALRMGVVGALDVLLLRRLHISHGSWMATTSIIVLQPYGSGTLRKTFDRVVGSIAGGVLAAALAAAIHSESELILVITVTSILTLATYAVDYAWFTFFLTPTFVLLSLPHLQDWRYAGVRMATTVLGATIALLAMRLLWPEQEQSQLGRLLGRGAAADAAYVRAFLRYWVEAGDDVKRAAADRELMAPARRRCGLAINDAEEALDRLMLQPSLGLRSVNGKDVKTTALTFVTFLRRLTRSVTTLAGVGVGDEAAMRRVEAVAQRLEAVGKALLGDGGPFEFSAGDVPSGMEGTGGVVEQQIRRMERQAGVMERAAVEILQETA